VRPGLADLIEFCELIDEPLHPHEKRIAGAYFGSAREIAAILPRGNAKTTLAARIGVHHLCSVPGAMSRSAPPHATRPASASSGCAASRSTRRSRISSSSGISN